MDLLHQLAAEGAETGTAVVAEEQLAGRGSRGRSWRSPPGGLWLSLLLRPASVGAELLGIRAGLAAAEALASLAPGQRFGLKWPNDLMLGDRKLGGILCEARWIGEAPAWTAVGIGINVSNPIPPGLARSAVALDEVLPGVSPEPVLEVLLPRLRGVDGSSPRLQAAELGRLAGLDWLLGRRVSGPIEGRACGIAPDGALRIHRDDGTVAEVRTGSVELALPSNSP